MAVETDPTPEQIAEAMAAIRLSWNDQTELSRRLGIPVKQLDAVAGWTPPVIPLRRFGIEHVDDDR